PKGGNAEKPKGVKEIRMPLMSDTMTEGKIVKWNKKVGDSVKSDDALADVETDKATMELIGYEEGTLLHIFVEAGDAAPINGIVALIGPKGTDVKAYAEAIKNQPAESTDEKPKESEADQAPETKASKTPAQ